VEVRREFPPLGVAWPPIHNIDKFSDRSPHAVPRQRQRGVSRSAGLGRQQDRSSGESSASGLDRLDRPPGHERAHT
jgi:hypothetical protein